MPKISTACLYAFIFSQTVCGYNLVQTYSGSSFFDSWTFADGWDHWTNGDIIYLPQAQAGNLTRLTENGNVQIRMDDFTGLGDNMKRNSIRIEGKQIFNSTNAVVVFDVVHVPTGCSVSNTGKGGSLWSKSAIFVNDWPKGGEVDIMEAVNKMTTNQMALHTDISCTMSTSNPNQSGNAGNADCQVTFGPDGKAINPQGCTVLDTQPQSYSTLAESGGGVWVAEYGAQALNIWFFPRANVPDALKGTPETLDTAALGKPVANYPSSSTCDISKALYPQHLVIDVTACGDCKFGGSMNRGFSFFLGAKGVLESTGCTPSLPNDCYNSYVHLPDNYHDAYCEWIHHSFCVSNNVGPVEIAAIKIFGDDTTLLQNSTELANIFGAPSATNTGSHTTPPRATSVSRGGSTSTSTPSSASKIISASVGSLLFMAALMSLSF
ncbi:hypothetical protein PIIN_09759 [Serendipita indica DSM 11827]|uniref:GH16 domain-containing protein n=1 Tax=Serendipita indica (strain DSM 11827) TaxID=1109443 RepID=G4TWS6_SERID|nr:hypothetical protein PIIN_09759 [Serendipita indica DSM 11827]